jgi:hypothetical protein
MFLHLPNQPNGMHQRAILNFTPGSWGRTLSPRGNVHPFTGVNTFYCLEERRDEQRILPPGDNFITGGHNSPLGDKFTPGVKVCP